MKRYPKYKDSGVPWLGQVPAHWEVKRGRFIFKVNGGFGAKSRKLECADVQFLPMEKIGEQNDLTLDATRAVDEKANSYVECLEGDVIVAKVTPCFENGKGAVARGLTGGAALATSEVHTLRPYEASPGFVYYATLSGLYRQAGAAEMYGVGGLRRVPPLFFKDARLAVPANGEQERIVDHLDRSISKMDTAISSQERMIELLKERRSAIITQAVTKGLDPKAKMKDSGVPWLGQVPAHWEVKRARYLCSIGTGSADTEDKECEATIPFYVRSQTVERISKATNIGEAILTAGDGAGVGKVYHHHRAGPFAAHQRVYVMQNFCGISPRYFYYAFSGLFAKIALDGGAKSTVDSLRRPMLTNFFLALPGSEEQMRITEYLDSMVSTMDSAISSQERMIELLKERRSVIITQAVTGQIDVR